MNNPQSVESGGSVLVGIVELFAKLSAQDIILLATLVVMLGGIWWQAQAVKKQLRLQNFSDYTKRYQDIILNFPENVNEPSFSFDDLPKDVRDKTMRYMRAYFDLCSEEYFLFNERLISRKIWSVWCGGMLFALSKAAFRQAWNVVRKDSEYDADFIRIVEDAIQK